MTPTLELDIPDFGFIVGTRALLAAGIALLAGSRLSAERRRALGVALVTVGAATTIPAVRSVVRGVRRARQRSVPSGIEFDNRLIGVTRYPRKGDDDRD
jgi:hypothetical protein